MIGRRSKNPTSPAIAVFFLSFNSCFLKPIAKITTSKGATILAVLNVYIERANDTAESDKYQRLFSTPPRNSHTPVTRKNVATFASNAARESIICQGETAR